jgi:hypothetical protein
MDQVSGSFVLSSHAALAGSALKPVLVELWLANRFSAWRIIHQSKRISPFHLKHWRVLRMDSASLNLRKRIKSISIK